MLPPGLFLSLANPRCSSRQLQGSSRQRTVLSSVLLQCAGGCNAALPVVHALLEPAPRVFTLQLAWESQHEEPAGIAAALAAVDEWVSRRVMPGPCCSWAGALLP